MPAGRKKNQLLAAEELLTVRDVAARLRVSAETVREWLRADELRGYNLGGRTGWRIPASEIDQLLRRHSGKRHRAARPPQP
jgi:excisionase family DNA binding protein